MPSDDQVSANRTAVGWTFAFNGFLFASLITRFPDVRESLELSNSALGLLLLGLSAGSVLALPTSGFFVHRFGAAAVVRGGATAVLIGMTVAALGATVLTLVPVAAIGLFTYGVGVSLWDVAMNVEGAEVERRLGRTIMPRFHAGWSVGSIAASLLGAALVAGEVPALLHLGVAALVGVPVVLRVVNGFGEPVLVHESHGDGSVRASAGAFSAWREPRTLALGVMVLAFAAVEGTANDWLTLAVIDGYDTAHWVGVMGYAVFVAFMTVGRLFGPLALDRFGRAPALWVCAGLSTVGVLLAVFGGVLALGLVGIALWGLGASLGFPVGLSAAADEPARAAARVSVVSTIGYAAFLVFPPFLGRLGDAIGTLQTLLVVAVLMLPAVFAIFAARPPHADSAVG